MKAPPPKQIKTKWGWRANPVYHAKDSIEHYVSPGGYYYCATLAELIMEVKQGKVTLIKRAAEKMKMFYDRILVDEFQDFREFDFDLICGLAKYADNVTLVGDFYQHSVSASNNKGRPFQIRKADVSYQDFVSNLRGIGFSVDENLLLKSRRCSKVVCEFISSKLGMNIESQEINTGSVKWIDESQLESILQNNGIIKLVFSKSFDYSFESVNWSYSKGDTIDETCVILTQDFEKLDQDDFSIAKISQSTINKLYVALSRTKGNLYLVKKSVFDKVKSKYLKG